MLDLTVTLTDDQVNSISRSFRRARHDDDQTTAQVLAELAVTAWIDWLSGDARYTSLTDQYANWLEAIYTHLLPEDEAPSADRLYNSFNIPYGQAQYIARVLNNKQLTHWRDQAVQRLKTAMEAQLDFADKYENDKTRNAKIVVDKLSLRELNATHGRLFQADPEAIQPIKIESSGDLYTVSIPAACFRAIYDAVGL